MLLPIRTSGTLWMAMATASAAPTLGEASVATNVVRPAHALQVMVHANTGSAPYPRRTTRTFR